MDQTTREFEEDVRSLLITLVKAALVGDGPAVDRWRGEGETRQLALRGPLASSPPDLNLDKVWEQALRAAKADETVARLENVNPSLPSTCPLTLSDLAALDFSFDRSAEAVRVSASTG